MLEFIAPASALLFTLENILWINLGVFIGAVFAAVPGLSVILCVILFLPIALPPLFSRKQSTREQAKAFPGVIYMLS